MYKMTKNTIPASNQALNFDDLLPGKVYVVVRYGRGHLDTSGKCAVRAMDSLCILECNAHTKDVGDYKFRELYENEQITITG